MPDIGQLLELAKSAARRAGSRVLDGSRQNLKAYEHAAAVPREVKALADVVLEQDILEVLLPTGISILSEESGPIDGADGDPYRFIVDPLDGTYNFVKGLGECGISIALWHAETPLFGVIFSLTDGTLSWGGGGIGAFCDNRRISVSTTAAQSRAAICTGFPARLDVDNEETMRHFWSLVSPYAKVRMLGSAALSLVHVANGSADAYSERNIMLWDVAAGIALVQGAGGRVQQRAGNVEYALDVFVDNGVLDQGRSRAT